MQLFKHLPSPYQRASQRGAAVSALRVAAADPGFSVVGGTDL